MLTELKVSHFAIIDHIHIHFNQGLNILSGETGAGKSILIKSLALLMGAKSSSQDIRSQRDQAIIEGAFDLSLRTDIQERLQSMGIELEDDQLIVRRVIHKNGKSKTYLNGHLSSLTDLRQIVFPLVTLTNPTDAPLIEMTGQHESKDLVSSRYQMDLLDQFADSLGLRSQVATEVKEIQEMMEQKNTLESLSKEREQQIDFLRYQIEEIESLDLEPNEDEVLTQKIKDIKQSDKWEKWRQLSLEQIAEADSSILALLKNIMIQTPEHSALAPINAQLAEAYAQLEDVAYQLQSISNDSDDQESLESLEERLSRIRKLQKKFGENTAQILQALEDMKTKYNQLTHLSQSLEQIDQKIAQQTTLAKKIAAELHKKRVVAAVNLAKEVNKHLLDLNMKGLKFLIDVDPSKDLMSTGMDRITFKTQNGPQDQARDLSKAASGGELSRILLSIKQVIGANHLPRTFLFDEVDTGVSGPTAEKVGAKLKNLAQQQQVICVTHLPQVASFADYHYFIEKTDKKDRVEMIVRALNKDQRVQEIARLISGEKKTKASLIHAKELINQAH
jgi:DNA repair protein RecN (Recombination protein N)